MQTHRVGAFKPSKLEWIGFAFKMRDGIIRYFIGKLLDITEPKPSQSHFGICKFGINVNHLTTTIISPNFTFGDIFVNFFSKK